MNRHPFQPELAKVTDSRKEKTREDDRVPNEWQLVRNKKQDKSVKNKRQQRQRNKPILSNALVIKKKGNLTYAEIFSRVKSDSQLTELWEKVTRIRRTGAEDLLMLLDRSADEKEKTKFRSAMEAVLSGEAEVKTRTHEIDVEIRELEEATTKKKVLTALIPNFEELQGTHIDSIKT